MEEGKTIQFIAAKDLRVGAAYVLTAYINGRAVSSGEYLLVEIVKPRTWRQLALLGFARVTDIPPQVYLEEMRPAFGDSQWRHVFKNGDDWDAFLPIGARSWTEACVEITPKP